MCNFLHSEAAPERKDLILILRKKTVENNEGFHKAIKNAGD